MKKLIFLLLLVTNSSLMIAQKNEDTAIRKLEKMEVNAVLKNDTIVLSKIWDKRFIVNSPNNNIIGAGKSIAERPALQRKRTSFIREIENITIQENLAISMGNETVVFEGEDNKPAETIKRRYTNIWVKKDGTWKLIGRHANVICD